MKIVDGEGMLAEPAEAWVLVLNEDLWPCNIPDSARGGLGISLLRYYIRDVRRRRGRRWTKALLAILYIPFHSTFLSILVQKLVVDHAVQNIVDEDADQRSVERGFFFPWSRSLQPRRYAA